VEEFESSFYQVQGHAVISFTEEYYDPETVIGIAEVSSVWGDLYIEGDTGGASTVSDGSVVVVGVYNGNDNPVMPYASWWSWDPAAGPGDARVIVYNPTQLFSIGDSITVALEGSAYDNDNSVSYDISDWDGTYPVTNVEDPISMGVPNFWIYHYTIDPASYPGIGYTTTVSAGNPTNANVTATSGFVLSVALTAQSNGASRTSSRVCYQWADDYIIEAYSQIIDYLYDRETAAFVDSATVSGIVPTGFSGYFESGRFTLSSSILSSSSLPGMTGETGPVSNVEDLYLRMDTPDSTTVSGEGIVRGFLDEYGTATGVAEMATDGSSGHDEDGESIGVAETSSVSSVVRLSADSNGSSLVTEGLYQLITNAAQTVYDLDPLGAENKAPDIAFRYTVSAIEEYTYVPALAGYVNGKSMLPGPTGPSGPVLAVAPTLLYYNPAALVGSSAGVSSIEANATVPRSYYDNAGPTGPFVKPGVYNTDTLDYLNESGEYA
jgi:hypothetical protein